MRCGKQWGLRACRGSKREPSLFQSRESTKAGHAPGRARSGRHLHPAPTPETQAALIRGRGPVRFAIKRVFDLVVGGLVLPVIWAVFVVIALALLASNKCSAL